MNTLLVERHRNNLGGLVCGQVNCDSLGGLLAATHTGDPGNGLLFSHVEDEGGGQLLQQHAGHFGPLLYSQGILGILDIGRNKLPFRGIEVGARLLLGVLAHERQLLKIRRKLPAVGRVNDQPEVACWLTLEADALCLGVFKGGAGAETIGTFQLAGIESCTPRGKGAVIGFHSLYRRDALHANGHWD